MPFIYFFCGFLSWNLNSEAISHFLACTIYLIFDIFYLFEGGEKKILHFRCFFLLNKGIEKKGVIFRIFILLSGGLIRKYKNNPDVIFAIITIIENHFCIRAVVLKCNSILATGWLNIIRWDQISNQIVTRIFGQMVFGSTRKVQALTTFLTLTALDQFRFRGRRQSKRRRGLALFSQFIVVGFSLSRSGGGGVWVWGHAHIVGLEGEDVFLIVLLILGKFSLFFRQIDAHMLEDNSIDSHCRFSECGELTGTIISEKEKGKCEIYFK